MTYACGYFRERQRGNSAWVCALSESPSSGADSIGVGASSFMAAWTISMVTGAASSESGNVGKGESPPEATVLSISAP